MSHSYFEGNYFDNYSETLQIIQGIIMQNKFIKKKALGQKAWLS